MTTETMTVHKALAELKILGGRIEAAILSGDFVITKKNNQDTVKGKTNASLQQKAEQFAVAMMGGKDVKDVKTDSDEYVASMNTYIKANTMTLLDPLGIETKIEELDDMINTFLPEVDAALSVSNAVTTITIEY